MVCVLCDTNSWYYNCYVSSCMACFLNFHPCDSSLLLVPARELARLSGIQRAPILHHFAESLIGAATIRAFGQEERFIHTNLGFIDRHSRPWFHNISAMEWLSFRLNLLSNFVFAFSLILLVSLPKGFINPSLAGLAVTYGLNLNSQLATIIWNICNTENKMISVERILQYSRIKSEAPLVIDSCRPPANWPNTGTICFTNLKVRYVEYLPSVLRNITCTIPGRKKVGVVGRTGSGKSTLIQALFRIVEPREGSIVIDNVDICKIGLHDLRARLSIIPQDPTMFEGTARGNLDPLNECPDQRIWEVLNKCQLGELVQQDEKKLELKSKLCELVLGLAQLIFYVVYRRKRQPQKDIDRKGSAQLVDVEKQEWDTETHQEKHLNKAKASVRILEDSEKLGDKIGQQFFEIIATSWPHAKLWITMTLLALL